MRKILLVCQLLAVAGMFWGCGGQGQTVSSEPACLSDSSVEEAMAAAETVLTKMRFEIEKYDLDARYIRTRPLSGSQFFQFGRQDNASASAAAQANLHSLRRVAELEFSTKGAAACVQCRVQVLRLSIPEQPIEGMGRMAGSFTKSGGTLQTLTVEPKTQETMEWLDAGSDPSLERRIVERIENAIQKRTR
ncbi:MAG: hypothetical protein L0Y36_00200 [Planctomycetales bacterium]|nr:hypothetical protein [Planctomycetales bacterium]